MDPLALKGGQNVGLPALVGLLREAHRFPPNRVKLVGGAVAIEAQVRASTSQLLPQRGHADHEELVHVGAEDGQELHSFQQGSGWIAGLFQHAFLEREQTELAIAVQLRVMQGLVR